MPLKYYICDSWSIMKPKAKTSGHFRSFWRQRTSHCHTLFICFQFNGTKRDRHIPDSNAHSLLELSQKTEALVDSASHSHTHPSGFLFYFFHVSIAWLQSVHFAGQEKVSVVDELTQSFSMMPSLHQNDISITAVSMSMCLTCIGNYTLLKKKTQFRCSLLLSLKS